MTSFVTRDVSHLGVDRVATSPTAFALYENLFAFAEKASGAPVLANDYVVTAMIANLNVTEGKLANSAVAQAKLKTATGEVSTTTVSLLTLPGGEYGFYPQIRSSTTTGNLMGATIGGLDEFTGSDWGTGYLTRIALRSPGAGNTALAQQRYVQASPPYDLGDGEVPLFVFALISSLGMIEAVSCALDPVWANNGPTIIRADFIDGAGRAFRFARPKVSRVRLLDPATRDEELAKLNAEPELIEITQAVKQADMPLIPHPFQGNDLMGKTIVMLDPVNPLIEKLFALHEAGESINALLHEDYLRIGNTPLPRAAPPGVMPVMVNWKST